MDISLERAKALALRDINAEISARDDEIKQLREGAAAAWVINAAASKVYGEKKSADYGRHLLELRHDLRAAVDRRSNLKRVASAIDDVLEDLQEDNLRNILSLD